MDGLFFRVFQHLASRSRALKFVVDKTLRSFFLGVSEWATDARKYLDDIYDDYFPQRTRKLPEWEEQFNLPNTVTVEQERRDRLDAAWKATGGQSPGYIQGVLRGAGFDVYVHESFESLGPPVYRNPNTYLQTGGDLFLARSGDEDMRSGEEEARSGNRISLVGFALTNLTGDLTIPDPSLPADPLLWPYFIYIGGETFPDPATVPLARRDEFLTLCLRICPTHLWIGALVQFA